MKRGEPKAVEAWDTPDVKRSWRVEELGTNAYRDALKRAGLEVYDASVASPPWALGKVVALFPTREMRDHVMALVNASLTPIAPKRKRRKP